MPPSIARIVFTVGIAGLVWLDRDRKAKTSPWIWIAVAWMFLGASRGLTEWLYGQSPRELDQYVDGSPIDRIFLSGLQLVAMAVLATRWQKSAAFCRRNAPLLLFFAYCLLSVAWSDFAFVAFKRWIKTMGNVAMVMLILTDDDPVTALKRALARTGFLLIPLSMLLIKYYPNLGRHYSEWTWTPSFIGAATDKNGLGVLALVFGLGAVWNLTEAFRWDTGRDRLQRVAAHAAVILIALWLFHMADSSTSLGCFILGSGIVAGFSIARIERPAVVHVLVGSMLFFGLAGYLFFDLGTIVIEALGRNSTLTGRTELWGELAKMRINPLLGTGFESFWLGDRAEYFWNKYWWHPNEAHNTYIELYLDLGWIGLSMLIVLIVSGYVNIIRAFRQAPGLGRIRLAFLFVALFYGITEAAFKMLNPVWVSFLLTITAVPALAEATRTAEEPAVAQPVTGTDAAVVPSVPPQVTTWRMPTAPVAGSTSFKLAR